MNWLLKNSHTVVSLGFTLVAFALGFNPIVAALIISAYWAGREVAQAEQRFIHFHTPNRRREEMHLLAAYYDRRAWNVKSFWGDMTVPFVLSFGLAYVLMYVI